MPDQPAGANILDMPTIRIRSTRLVREQELRIEIESTLTSIKCRQCGRAIDEIVGYAEPRRLPNHTIAARAIEIVFYPKLFRCPNCADHPVTTEQFQPPATDGSNERIVGA